MLTLQDADQFFSTHILGESFAGFPENRRRNAVMTAARDIAGALGLDALPDPLPENIRCAVFEQALFLLLNPHIFANTSGEKPSITLSHRACIMLPEQPLQCNLKRG